MRDYFSTSYAAARQRFQQAAESAGAEVASYFVDVKSKLDLSIDVATIGAADAPSIVISSGVHGIEGFCGSAIQSALLDRLGREVAHESNGLRFVLIHGVNPFGFAQLRRVNEDNVDLNRNFLDNAADYTGTPPGYTVLNRFLNPESEPRAVDLFGLHARWNAWRFGLQSLKQSVAGGQYEYPRGLFFGGTSPSTSFRLIRENCDKWLAESNNILHIDIHSGLGPRNSYKVLLSESSTAEDKTWGGEAFGINVVEPLGQTDGTAYSVNGLFCDWMQRHFHSRDYRYVGAEFGTHAMIRVLAALRAENRAHFYAAESSPAYRRAKNELLECFCPASLAWRRNVVESGLKIIEQGSRALSQLATTMPAAYQD